ncbi:alpha/beta fold hydrolase [Roseicella frigidaeris]|nr:alpha/beta hydrolase [Roseicella frigidaeris]
MEAYRYGNGPVRAVLIHGWFGDAHDFDAMLAAMDPDLFSLACVEFRGFGARRGEPGPYDVATIARDAVALADELGWERFDVVGHSMGGKAALRVAVEAPGRVGKLCGIAPVWAGRSPFDEQRLGLFRKARDVVGMRQGIVANTTGGRLPAIWSRRVAEHSMRISDPDAFAAYFESWALEDFAREAAAVTAETLVIVGAHDPGITEAVARATWLATLPNAQLVVMPDSGHYPAQECPLILAAHVTRFLAPG